MENITLIPTNEIKTYKGVPVEAQTDIVEDIALKFAKKQARALDDLVSHAMEITLGDWTVRVNKERLIKWAQMCKFLEENATEEDKKNIGALLYCKDLEKKIEAKDKRIEEQKEEIRKLEDKIQQIRDVLGGEYYDE